MHRFTRPTVPLTAVVAGAASVGVSQHVVLPPALKLESENLQCPLAFLDRSPRAAGVSVALNVWPARGLSTEPGTAERPPNFLVLVADDAGWQDFWVYGEPGIQTPNIDRLAQSGLVFDRAFLTAAQCSRSRNSILTGRYPHRHRRTEGGFT